MFSVDFTWKDFPVVTFSHFQDGVLVKLTALDILHLHWPLLSEAVLCNVDRGAVESLLESHRAVVIVKHGITAVKQTAERLSGATVCHLAAIRQHTQLNLMVCDRAQQQEIARLQIVFTQITASFNVTTVMEHQRVSGGVKRRKLVAYKNDSKTQNKCQIVFSLFGWGAILLTVRQFNYLVRGRKGGHFPHFNLLNSHK